MILGGFNRGARRDSKGFTLVELLVVIVVIGIISTLVIILFGDAQQKARDAKRASDISAVARIVESYYAINGTYPSTGGLGYGFALGDANCTDSGTHTANWIPNVVPSIVAKLPQSDGPRVNGLPRCYKYVSDGTSYIISAWGAVENSNWQQHDKLYRNLGFREPANSAADGYYCGNLSTPPNYWTNWYALSYTISNITTCNGGT